MALTFSVVDTWDDGKRIHVCGTVTATGNYTTGGDTLDLSQFPLIASDQPPIRAPAGWTGSRATTTCLLLAATMNANKVKIFQQGSGGGGVSGTGGGSVSGGDHGRHDYVLRDL